MIKKYDRDIVKVKRKSFIGSIGINFANQKLEEA